MITPPTESGVFNKILQDILTTLKKELHEVKSFNLWGGGFDGLEDFKNFTTQAPSLLVGLQGVGPTALNSSNQLEITLQLGLLFIVKDIKTLGSRHKVANIILEKLLLLIKDGKWNSDPHLSFTKAESINAKNYFGSELKVSGVAMWGISWQQKYLLGKDIWNEELPKEEHLSC